MTTKSLSDFIDVISAMNPVVSFDAIENIDGVSNRSIFCDAEPSYYISGQLKLPAGWTVESDPNFGDYIEVIVTDGNIRYDIAFEWGY